MHKAIIFLCLFATLAYVFAVNCPVDEEFPSFFPHETDCTLYYECDNGIPILMQCGNGTAFNPEENVCDFPENVPGC